ncbi:hypothetical protein [Bifidobacterium phasiani]|uniref:Cell division protein FtsL n=1 Tax=Bifidobacterium phasiani TaxID=2834431 RepID=A0ABS6WAR1_9BIFI|nr:hypothetical protein [Bifidobacterium phasiani]MBW3083603.1 hypothetical protein [Bifidobacterium phasiani]
MPAPARSARSGAQTQPAGRPAQATPAATRPQLRVVKGRRADDQSVSRRLGRIIEWTRSRTTPLLHVTASIVFLGATLLGALALRTQMVQNSFEAAQVESNIATLNQDVQDAQSRLDELEASLPEKAKEMGMVPQEGSISIDLSDYQPSGGAQ